MQLPLLQTWLPAPDPELQSGTVNFTWKAGVLNLKVDLTDKEVITTATANQQRLWEHGDVCEFFVQRFGESGYQEYQVSPNGFTLALKYPDLLGVAAVRSGERPIDEFFLQDSSIMATAEFTETGWMACFSIPLIGDSGDRIRVSCCRYDAGARSSTILSSTSPHPVRDFHRPQDWREMILMEE